MVMTKTPVAGKVKTRLARDWGDELALQGYILLVEKTLATVEQSGLPRQLHIAGELQHPLWQQAKQRGWQLHPQCDGDLGDKMLAASAGQPSILVGCDFPGLSSGRLQDVARKLQSHDAVVIPATDGGYVLLGLKQACPEIFDGPSWGSSSVWNTTQKTLNSLRLKTYVYPAEDDLDTAEDWSRAVSAGLLPKMLSTYKGDR